MKNILIGVGIVIALLVGGFFALNAYIYNEKQSDTKRVVAVGSVTAVDLEPMTYDGPGRILITTTDGKNLTIEVPARMNLCAAKDSIDDVSQIAVNDTIEVTGDLTAEGVVVPCESMEHYLRVTLGAHIDRSLGFAFEFKKGKEGYVLTVPPHGNEEASDFEDAVVLMQKSDYDAMQSGSAMEGPPSITALVYKNTKKLSARAWADANKSVSNIELKIGEVTDTIVQGAQGVRYEIDGLYRAEMLVVTFGDYVYVLSGSYLDAESAIRNDFSAMLNTFIFFTPK